MTRTQQDSVLSLPLSHLTCLLHFPFISPRWAFCIRLARPWPPAGARCPWDLSHHRCIPAYHFTGAFDGCALLLPLSFSMTTCAKWLEYSNTLCSLIFTVSVRVSPSRPWRPCSPRSITAAVDSSHCAAAPVEIISLSAACLFPRCQPMPTVVYLQFALPQCCQQTLISPFSVPLIFAYYHMPNCCIHFCTSVFMSWMQEGVNVFNDLLK